MEFYSHQGKKSSVSNNGRPLREELMGQDLDGIIIYGYFWDIRNEVGRILRADKMKNFEIMP